MSLALSFFFWDDADWSGGAPEEPVVVAEPEQGRGSGKKRKHANYIQADDAFWEIRERYLEAMHAPLSVLQDTTKVLPSNESIDELAKFDKPANFYIKALPRYESEKAALLELAKLATSIDQLRSYTLRLNELNKAIQTAKAERKRQKKQKLNELVALGKALIELLR